MQVLATVRQVEKLGYHTEIIRYQKKLSASLVMQSAPRLLNHQFIRNKFAGVKKNWLLSRHTEIADKVQVRNRRFEEFADRYFSNLSPIYLGWKALETKAAQNYDGFLCGSDQLWLPSNLGSHFYTLEFAPEKKGKIAYATSFGVSRIPFYQKRRTAKYLSRLQAISVREIAGTKIVEALTGKKIQVVCDPTLLFDRKEWEDIIPKRKVIDVPYIFCYFLGENPEHRRAAMELRKETGLTLVSCPFLDCFVAADLSFGDIQLYDIDAADFVNLIRYAEYILTDSFHGSIFSILNHKKWMVFDRYREGSGSRNSRIDSLCTLLGAADRRYSGSVVAVEQETDYGAIEDKIAELRIKSIKYLQEALERI